MPQVAIYAAPFFPSEHRLGSLNAIKLHRSFKHYNCLTFTFSFEVLYKM